VLCKVVATRVVWPSAAHQFSECLRVIQHLRGHGLTVKERGRGACSVLVFENLVALARPLFVAAVSDGGRDPKTGTEMCIGLKRHWLAGAGVEDVGKVGRRRGLASGLGDRPGRQEGR
jgi:hypothetical protein